MFFRAQRWLSLFIISTFVSSCTTTWNARTTDSVILAGSTPITVTPSPTPPLAVLTPQPELRDSPACLPYTEFEWFIPSEQILAAWCPTLPEPLLENTLLLVPLIPQSSLNSPQTGIHILFLLSIPDSQTVSAISQVLTTFLGRGLYPTATIAMAEDIASVTRRGTAGREALAYAEANGYDLIFAVGPSTTEFIRQNYAEGILPVVTMLSQDPVLLGMTNDYQSGSGNNIAYTTVNVPVDVQMTYYRQLVPELQNIVIIYDFNDAIARQTQVNPFGQYALTNTLNIMHIAILRMDDPDAARAELQDKFPHILVTLRQIDSGNSRSIFLVANSPLINQIFDMIYTLAGDIPVVSLLPELVQPGQVSAVMSVGISSQSNAVLAADFAIHILLEGTDPGTLPVGTISPPNLAVNFAAARHIGLRIPFTLFENATQIYDASGRLVREDGHNLTNP